MEQTHWLKGIDWVTIILCFTILGFGILNIYSVDPAKGIKQLIWLGLGLGLITFLMIISTFIKNFFLIYSWLFYSFGILALVGVLIFGKEINGAKAWFSFGSISLQPAEFVKITTGLFLAYTINLRNYDFRNISSIIIIFLILLLPIGLILLQPDVGSILVYFAFIIALYREGLNWSFVVVPIFGIFVFLFSLNQSPFYFLIITGLITISMLILITLILGLRRKRFNQYLLGVNFAIGILFIFLMIFTFLPIPFLDIHNEFNSNSKVFYGLNVNKSIFFFFSIVGLILCAGYFFLIKREKKTTEITNPFQSDKSYIRYIQAGLFTSFLIISVLICISFSAKVIFNYLPKHQKERVMVLFEGEKKYRDTSGYNLLYSKTAIGSGELYGKGFQQGTVKRGSFVPEQSTDYIFCTVGEEWGFIGSVFVLILYAFLTLRIYWLAERETKKFPRFFGYSVASILFLHYMINVAMVTGLFPTVGIPLPLFSYGGSSLWSFSLLISIFLILHYKSRQSLF